jgi:hypothetical protein
MFPTLILFVALLSLSATLDAQIALTPSMPSVPVNGTVQFKALVNGAPSDAIIRAHPCFRPHISKA